MKDLQLKVDTIMQAHCPPGQPGASLLVACGDDVIIKSAYGTADLENSVPADPETTYLIASVSKQFTCAAVMLLAEAGKLDIDAPLGRYKADLPSYRDIVTIRQLMTHTSGIPDYFDPAFHRDYCRENSPPLTQSGLIAHISERFPKTEFTPGSDWAYSNSAYVILGDLIERVSGQPFEDFLDERIFQPLGMTRTRVGTSDQPVEGMALGYQREKDGSFGRSPYNRTVVGWADGNMISSCGDLHTWLRAIHTGKIFTAASRRQVLSPAILPNGRNTHYGFGWFFFDRRGLHEHWHTGSTVGYHCRVSYFVDEEVTLVCLLNSEHGSTGDLNLPFTRIVNEVLGKQLQPLPELHPLHASCRKQWLGRWTQADFFEDHPLEFEIIETPEDSLKLQGKLFGTSGEWLLIPETDESLYLDSGADYRLIQGKSSDGNQSIALNCHGRIIEMALKDKD